MRVSDPTDLTDVHDDPKIRFIKTNNENFIEPYQIVHNTDSLGIFEYLIRAIASSGS